MLKKLTLTNFQAHKDTTIDLSTGVNVIVGRSDRGKSSIIRSLQLLFFNRPGGSSYIRHGAKECRVDLELATGVVLSRIRGKSKNQYQINDDEPLKAPGRDVPEEVLAECPIQEINFQGQHDSPFMLSETAGECGRMLNRLVDLTVIDRILSSLNTNKRNTSNKLEFTKETMKDLRSDCAKYADVSSMRTDADALAETLKKNEILARGISDASKAIDSYSSLFAEVAEEKDPSEALESIVAIEGLGKAVAQAAAQGEILEEAIYEAHKTALDLHDMKESEALLQEEYDSIMKDACPLCGQPVIAGESHE